MNLPPHIEGSFQSVSETAADAIIIIDEHNMIMFINGAAENVFGYSPQELLGHSMAMLVPGFLLKAQEAGLQRHMDTREQYIHSQGTELPGLRRNGIGIALEISFGEFNQGDQRFYTGVIRNITQRKHDLRLKTVYTAAAKLLAENPSSDRVLSETLQGICQALEWKVGILWQVDSTAEVLRWASGWSVGGNLMKAVRGSRDMQFSPEAGLPGRVWFSKEPAWISPLEADPDFSHTRGFTGGDLLSGTAFPVIIQAEVVAVMEFFTTDLEPPDQTLIDVFKTIGQQIGQYIQRTNAEQALAKNEAELRRLVQSEQEARLQAEAANSSKDEFLATISHELRTPLTSIFGWVHLLQGGIAEPEIVAKALEVIERNVRAQTRIIDDLLNTSEMLTGKLRLRRELLNPVAAVTAAIETVRSSADAKQIAIILESDPRVHTLVADPGRLQQIVWNLLLNAVKFTAIGGLIRVNMKWDPGDLHIIVSDNGEGISADFLPFVFQRFTQADTTSSRVHGGLGIGLALVKQLVELHGGRVTAESAGKNQGSRFTVSLPLPPVVTKFPDRRAPSSRSALRSPPALAGVRVLLVEDDVDTRHMVAHALEEFGASVVQASSGADALRELDSRIPDLLICDIGMPEMNGYELLAIMRQRRAQMPPAVALTAYASQTEKERALRAGFQAHLAKPVALPLLFSVAASLLARSA